MRWTLSAILLNQNQLLQQVIQFYFYNQYVIYMISNLKQFLNISEEDLKQEAFLKQKEEVFFLCLNKKGNTFSLSLCRKINELLNIVENHEGNTALVTLSTQKLFSGGLDLNLMMGEKHHNMDKSYFVLQVIRLFGRIVALSVPTFALVHGSAVAGGCMFALSHDEIYVYEKATFYCNQIQIGLSLPPGMAAVIKRKLNPKEFRDMTIYARRFSGQQGLKCGFVDGIFKENPVQSILKIAKQKSKYGNNKTILKAIKMECNRQVLNACWNRQLDGGLVGEGGFGPKL